MKLMEDRQGIKFSKISYIPASEVRTGALLQGNVKATIVDSAGRRLLETQAPGKFVILPLEGVNATDEALFANTNFLEKNAADVDKIVEAILTTWREVTANPAVVTELAREIQAAPGPAGRSGDRDRPVISRSLRRARRSRSMAAVPRRRRTTSPSTPSPVSSPASPPSLKVEDFWDTRPLDRALAKLGTK